MFTEYDVMTVVDLVREFGQSHHQLYEAGLSSDRYREALRYATHHHLVRSEGQRIETTGKGRRYARRVRRAPNTRASVNATIDQLCGGQS